MNKFIPRKTKRDGPEAKIQSDIMNYLTLRDWFVKSTHGNMYQSGLPDLFATHKNYGQRWIEVKNPDGYSFTAAQLETFPKLIAFGSGVWVLVGANEYEYKKLFSPCNYWTYLL